MIRTRFSKSAAWMILPALCMLVPRAPAQEWGVPGAMPPPPSPGWGAAMEASAPRVAAADTSSPSSLDLAALQSLGTALSGDAIIQYDAGTNSIMVITDEHTSREIAQVIQTLDQPVPQVLIKVLFLEVTHSSGLDFGFEGQFTFQDAAGGERHTAGTDFGLSSMTTGGFYTIVDEDFSATLRAMATQGKLEVLSRPSVLVRNNESATITIGQEVPFITNSRITDGGDTINTVTYEDIGIILGVTPHITRERLVEMEVTPEISTLTAETVPISNTVDARIIAKRSAQTRVAVADGQTVVIGGLMEDNNTSNVKKLPLLGDIPLLGALFSRTVKNKSKTELLIFLTPTVIESVAGLDKMTRDERSLLELSPRVLREPAAQRKYIAPLDAIPDESQE